MSDTSTMRQIPLDLGHMTAMGREDFLLAPCNRDAVGWIDRWPGWPAPALILFGPAASGKSHLAAVWSHKIGAVKTIPGAVLSGGDAEQLMGQGQHLVIDHVDPWIGDRDAETTLFHLYNMAKERGITLLLTMRMGPGQVEFSLPDLASRLRAAPAVEIAPPDETVLAAVLVKLFADRQIAVGADVLAYILPRMERSFAAAHDLVARADQLAMSEKKPVTIPLMRRVMADI